MRKRPVVVWAHALSVVLISRLLDLDERTISASFALYRLSAPRTSSGEISVGGRRAGLVRPLALCATLAVGGGGAVFARLVDALRQRRKHPLEESEHLRRLVGELLQQVHVEEQEAHLHGRRDGSGCGAEGRGGADELRRKNCAARLEGEELVDRLDVREHLLENGAAPRVLRGGGAGGSGGAGGARGGRGARAGVRRARRGRRAVGAGVRGAAGAARACFNWYSTIAYCTP